MRNEEVLDYFYQLWPTLINYISGSFHCRGLLHILVESPGSILPYSKLIMWMAHVHPTVHELKHRTKRKYSNFRADPPKLKAR